MEVSEGIDHELYPGDQEYTASAIEMWPLVFAFSVLALALDKGDTW